MLHVETVGRVTSPVTQVAVVAVNRASRYPTEQPLAELIGRTRSRLPKTIVIKKLSRMICVVDNEPFFLLFITVPLFFVESALALRGGFPAFLFLSL